jgi:alpha-mannosidase
MSITADELANHAGVRLQLAPERTLHLPGAGGLAVPALELLRDPTDTWSHRVDRYEADCLQTAVWDAACVVESGPLLGAVRQEGRIGRSDLRAEWRVYATEPGGEMRLTVHRNAAHRLLKLSWPLPRPIVQRRDGIANGDLVRPANGREVPIHDRTWLQLADGTELGVVCPDCYALDATSLRLRLTLLRSPLMAHHDPCVPTHAHGTLSDQGVHTFRFRFWGGSNLAALAADAFRWHRPPLTADLTRGMPAH